MLCSFFFLFIFGGGGVPWAFPRKISHCITFECSNRAKPSRIPSFAFLASQMTTVNDVQFGTFRGPFLPWIIPNGSTDSFVHWIMAEAQQSLHVINPECLGHSTRWQTKEVQTCCKGRKRTNKVRGTIFSSKYLKFDTFTLLRNICLKSGGSL